MGAVLGMQKRQREQEPERHGGDGGGLRRGSRVASAGAERTTVICRGGGLNFWGIGAPADSTLPLVKGLAWPLRFPPAVRAALDGEIVHIIWAVPLCRSTRGWALGRDCVWRPLCLACKAYTSRCVNERLIRIIFAFRMNILFNGLGVEVSIRRLLHLQLVARPEAA